MPSPRITIAVAAKPGRAKRLAPFPEGAKDKLESASIKLERIAPRLKMPVQV
jgi:hypothetical protein